MEDLNRQMDDARGKGVEFPNHVWPTIQSVMPGQPPILEDKREYIIRVGGHIILGQINELKKVKASFGTAKQRKEQYLLKKEMRSGGQYPNNNRKQNKVNAGDELL
eukprot:TRINITY_DN2472_c1_g1_i1.p2 TRINITY_DN2472_c1_g1~~TRINITY_DN2472_c1_g1_i1.p2  ORF type:complete len:106 (-),score=24.41 TRINITY_DN2472_c1_g1_i1:436-753(-)